MPERIVDLSPLETGDAHHFGDWSNSPAPRGPTGVYTVWRGAEFVYAGMAYRDAGDTANPQARGLWGRLRSHASGRRSGDQFCIYICDRYVLPRLSLEDIRAVGEGRLSLDTLTRDYIREHLGYRYLQTESGLEARSVERLVRGGQLPSRRKPMLNPLGEPAPTANRTGQRPEVALAIDIDELWSRLGRHEGEEFKQIRGKPFRYSLTDAGLAPDTTDWVIPRTHLATALERVPLKNTVPVQDLFGPSYVYAVLMDRRIRRHDW